jgi:hypothetical protein
MAEDKRIRVSADTTPLQEVRQAARELWEDLAQMETNFKQINDGVLQSIQKQIDLLKERNSLYTAFNPQEQTNTQQGQNNRNAGLIDPYTGRPLFDKTEGQGIRNADFEKALNVLDKISSDVTRIAETLEQDQRNQQNGLVPGEGSQPAPLPNPAGGNPLQPPQQPNAPTGGRGGGFSLPTSLQGMMSLLPYGAALFGIGQMIGQQFQFQAMQYGAQNEFQRRNNVGKNPLLNMLSFGITGAKADEAEVGRLAAEQNDKVLKDYSALFGVSYNESLRRQITGSFGGNYNNLFDQTIGAPKSRSDSYIRVSEGGDTSRVVTGDKTRAEEANKAAGISKEEFQNWASTVLGLNITEFTEKITSLSRAGAKGSNTTDDDLKQLLLAQRLRGITDEQAEDVLRTTRFRRNEQGLTGAGVISAFDANLSERFAERADANQLIASTLGEYLAQFNQISDRILDRVGSVNTTNIVRSMTSIQNATKMEGKQLERVQNALMGNDISQDDTTQALLLRTARQLNPEGNLSDLQADIEDMANNPELQKAFFGQIRQMTGGGEQMRHVLKAIFPQLSMSDIKKADLGQITEEELFDRGRTQGAQYSDRSAARMVGDAERSTAGTMNRKIFEGYENVMGAEQLKAVLESIEKPIPVFMTFEGAHSIMESIRSFTEILSDTPKALSRVLKNLTIEE